MPVLSFTFPKLSTTSLPSPLDRNAVGVTIFSTAPAIAPHIYPSENPSIAYLATFAFGASPSSQVRMTFIVASMAPEIIASAAIPAADPNTKNVLPPVAVFMAPTAITTLVPTAN